MHTSLWYTCMEILNLKKDKSIILFKNDYHEHQIFRNKLNNGKDKQEKLNHS